MLERVLVPLDGSPFGETILPWVRALVARVHPQIHLLRVIPPPITYATVGLEGPMVALPAPPDGDVLGQRQEAEAYLTGFADLATGERAMVRQGEPAAEIVAAARASGADLIAMSTHGRTGLGRLVLGSVAETVMRTAGIPIVLIRPAETR